MMMVNLNGCVVDVVLCDMKVLELLKCVVVCTLINKMWTYSSVCPRKRDRY